MEAKDLGVVFDARQARVISNRNKHLGLTHTRRNVFSQIRIALELGDSHGLIWDYFGLTPEDYTYFKGLGFTFRPIDEDFDNLNQQGVTDVISWDEQNAPPL